MQCLKLTIFFMIFLTFSLFSQAKVVRYPPAQRKFLDNWQSSSFEKCPEQRLSRSKVNALITRRPDCQPMGALTGSATNREWHPTRPGLLACASEISGAQEAIDTATLRMFQFKKTRPWLREVFDCDPVLLQKILLEFTYSPRKFPKYQLGP